MMNKLFSLIFLVIGISSVSSQSAEPPVSDDACTALKSIASDTQGTIAPCTVQEGCGILVCNSIAGVARITLQPCTDPPSFLTQFFDTSNNLVYEQNMTGNNSYTIPLGTTITLLFEVKQFDDDAISVKVDTQANIGGSVSPFIPETKVPSSKCLCEGSTSLTECATMAATTITTTTVVKISTSEPAVIVSTTNSPPPVIAPSSARAISTIARDVATTTATVMSMIDPGAARSTESPTAGSGLSIVSLPAMISLLMLFTAFIMLLT